MLIGSLLLSGHASAVGSWSSASTGLTDLGVTALVVDPTSPLTAYAGTPSGIWKTADGGGSWSSANAGASAYPVQSLAIAPNSAGTLFAGYGATMDFPYPVPGPYRSANGGHSWVPASLGLSDDVHSIAAASSQIAYAGTSLNDVYRTLDGGDTWTRATATLQDMSIMALAVDPSAPQTVYAGNYFSGLGPASGVYKSTDGGRTFPTAGLTGLTVQALAIDRSAPQTVYAGTNTGEVWKTIDGGVTWSPSSTGLTSASVKSLAIDPAAPGMVYAGTTSGVFSSNDGGANWAPDSDGIGNQTIDVVAVAPGGGQVYAAGFGLGVYRRGTVSAGGPPPASAPAPTPPVPPALRRVVLRGRVVQINRGSHVFLRVAGRVASSEAGRRLLVERRVGNRYVRLCWAKVSRAGRFTATCRVDQLIRGRRTTVRVRARLPATRLARAATQAFVVRLSSPVR